MLSNLSPCVLYFVIFSAYLFTGCAGTVQLKSQLKTAQHERDVLRDAYEAQQLRLRELELRLLKLEDRQFVGQRETRDVVGAPENQQSTRPHVTAYLTSPRAQSASSPPQGSNQRSHHHEVHANAKNPGGWREQEVRPIQEFGEPSLAFRP